MIPFSHTWPYEIVMGDIYVEQCPFCSQEHVLLPLKPKQLSAIHDGQKKLLVFPCCHNRITLLDCDDDYLLADVALR
ncbi:hypothetical protein [Paenibacillus massiliensis]|uniref:hypothetical protein n=1 Tax=Paenibacillus massiliensis TaxID=225917 RepID=UPI0003FAD231|nr:hypothetical protein [Paenibacillus massiliensis]